MPTKSTCLARTHVNAKDIIEYQGAQLSRRVSTVGGPAHPAETRAAPWSSPLSKKVTELRPPTSHNNHTEPPWRLHSAPSTSHAIDAPPPELRQSRAKSLPVLHAARQIVVARSCRRSSVVAAAIVRGTSVAGPSPHPIQRCLFFFGNSYN